MRVREFAPLIVAVVGLLCFRILAVHISGMSGVMGVLGDPAIIAAQGVAAIVVGLIGVMASGLPFRPIRWGIICFVCLIAWRIAFVTLRSFQANGLVFSVSLIYDALEWVVVIVAAALVANLVDRAVGNQNQKR